MKYLYEDEMAIILKQYNDAMDNMKVADILTMSTEDLANRLSLSYRQLYYTVKANNADLTRGQISYKVLKLRRMLAHLDDKCLKNCNLETQYQKENIEKKVAKSKEDPNVSPFFLL